MKNTVTSYEKAGVNINAIKRSQKEIGNLISKTHKTQSKVKVASGFGHYGGIVELADNKMLTIHTDGVGTKTIIAQMVSKFDTVGIDCVAMNVNDIICVGATPISFVDYIAANKNNQAIFKKIVGGLVKGALEAKVPIVGGETAIMPDLISGETIMGKKKRKQVHTPRKNDSKKNTRFAFDLAGTVVGMCSKKEMILGNSINDDDVIVGVESSGIHSNGYSLVRKVLLPRFKINERIHGMGRLGSMLLAPTRIYARPVLELLKGNKKEYGIRGLAHITGGAFTKLLRLKNTGYFLDSMPDPPKIFHFIKQQGSVSQMEMYKTFNMGIGFCVVCDKKSVSDVIDVFKKSKMSAYQIGKIDSSKKGVYLDSKRLAKPASKL